ncbi:LLM class flavin-dependent oxidoreductase [Saccharibacillus sp. CPCC 101409]|uniref:LLM class flavin-dependent oxidoreductase n=1 Tax=Saccharibacillus sp. CPCC 101409 TaxID=3058041 RepID=UPI0026737A0B|nr:LLM class flavin-dependent oxidoreductase [Saccharibacillus sp. CPCC 101409]MDO3409428.1 LLM class flavin-dependent oxidoreductase [Saccharibacillus sp. CPCC 101409]
MTHLPSRKLRLGAFLTAAGSNVAAWRHHATPADAPVNLAHIQTLASLAEQGKFDFLFIADSAYITKDSTPYFLSRFDPMTILSALAVTTKHIGLVGTFTTSYSEPFTTARQLASLDKLSGGRAGWNAVTSALEGLGRNHGQEKIMEHSLRYRVAGEYLEVAKGLWDSWEDDAFVRNKETGQYADFDKMHTLDHEGEFFKVQGPLNMERSPQGRPILFQAGGSDAGKRLAAKHADAIFSRHSDLKLAAEFARDIREQLASFGRGPDELRIFPTITPIVGATEEEAQRRYEETCAYVDIELALKYLSRYFSFHDFSQYPLDEPLPEGLEQIGKDSFKSTSELYLRIAREEGLTLRQLALRVSTPRGDFVGTPRKIADTIQKRFETGDIDGYIISGHVQPEGLRDFVEQVVPILQERGLFRTEYEEDTLRGHLGLQYPVNRYTAQREREAGAVR